MDAGRIIPAADQYPEIARRLREIREEKQAALNCPTVSCVRCNDAGWIAHAYLGYATCAHCGNPGSKLRP